ncbi:hypothetical protein FDH32_gp09 [Acinetobacter phage vB_AbaP_AS11]|uniref:Uncharacterized protein n=1 Tax=Acinetobacter phage vB_AbaP_AS11 TaxID=1932886 RepID=A0A218KS04_9CAUD|nr:hypothetical protein FDH32_gp09 [Acinetobacter phage vB_AbaP_AS11]AQN32661.1 hypothetical protein AS11_gp09 [Acinetobacter phage vB_AbaP_AS11]ULG00635.1 hypothetical protein PE21_gp09 [Acinetobacter phage vB_AbaP_PE21]
MTKRNAYPVGKFNNVEWIGNPIYNHKVEQVLRAVLLGEFSTLRMEGNNIHAVSGGFTYHQQPTDHVRVGKSTVRGWCFEPTTNSFLIRLGIKPSALLLRLAQQHLNGVMLLREQGEDLFIPFAALYQAAYLAVFKPELLNKELNEYVSKHGTPKHFAVEVKGAK